VAHSHNSFSSFVVCRERLKNKALVVGYGHIGDGNLHLNVSAPKYNEEVFNLIEPFLFEWIGTDSAKVFFFFCLFLLTLLCFVCLFVQQNIVEASVPNTALVWRNRSSSTTPNRGLQFT
jgi:hypothetical protein